MSEVDQINQYILEQLKGGKIEREKALSFLKYINKGKEDKNKSIAIIGMACKLPGAQNKEEFWDNILKGAKSIGKYPKDRRKDSDMFLNVNGESSDDPYPIMGYLREIDKFDNEFFNIPPKEAVLLDPCHRLALEVSYEAIEDAGYCSETIHGTNTGVFIGVDHTSKPQYMSIIAEPDFQAQVGSWSGILASRISYIFNLRGPSIVIDTACSSGLVSLHTACKALQNGECSMAVAGGLQLFFWLIQKSELGVEASDYEIRPFDSRANGTVWGEGVVFMMLKPLKKAIEDKDNIYAVIKGSAINNDGASNGITAPNADAQTEVIIKAWQDADVNPETISYIETHATGTKIGDPIEIKGIDHAFKKYTKKNQFCAIGWVKANIGHTIGASGMASLLKLVLSMKNKVIPGSINFEATNRFIDFSKSSVYINDTFREWPEDNHPRRAGVSSFGFSGTNCHVILDEAPQVESYENQGKLEVFMISAKSEVALKNLVKKYKTFIDTCMNLDINNICYTANCGRGHYNYRIAIIVNNLQDFKAKIEILVNSAFETIINPDIYFGRHRVVSGNKGVRNKFEISEDEKRSFSSNIDEKLKEFLNQVNSLEVFRDICALYVKGGNINWDRFYKNETRRRVSLPPYQFERKRFWPDVSDVIKRYQYAKKESQSLCYRTIWKPKPEINEKHRSIAVKTLIFTDECGRATDIIRALENKDTEIIEVQFGQSFIKSSHHKYTIAGIQEDFYRLFNDIEGEELSQIIHMSTISLKKDPNNLDELKKLQEKGIFSLLYLARAISHSNIRSNIDIALLSDSSIEVNGEEKYLTPLNAMMFAFGNVLRQEYKNLKCRCIDFDELTSSGRVIEELFGNDGHYKVAYRDNKRYVEEFEEVEVSNIARSNVTIRDNGVYIITGGTGGIGLEMAKYLSLQKRVRLVLINRSKFPERETWDSILRENKENNLLEKISILKQIESSGSNVICYSADISNMEHIQPILQEVYRTYGCINGIIHSAGVYSEGAISDKDKDVFEKVISPKVNGTWLLDKLTEEIEMDFFIAFSSVASLLGLPNMGDYVAANAYLDAFTFYRNKTGKRTMTIAWPTWSETGLAVNNGLNFDGAFKAISNNLAINSFNNVFYIDMKYVLIGELNYLNETIYREEVLPFDLSFQIKNRVEEYRKSFALNSDSDNQLVDIKIMGRGENEEYTETERRIVKIWGNLLGLNEINIYDNFFELGGNSLLTIKLEVLMEKNNLKIKYSDIDSYPTIKELAAYINGEEQNVNKKDDDVLENMQNNQDKIIDSIEPYNDIFYKSCLYNSLFPVIRHFNMSIMPLILNDVIIYCHDDQRENISLSIEYLEVKPVEQILDEMGIKVEAQIRCEDVIREIICSILNGNPVILWIDCFYESIRPSMYQKEHWPHTILFYGFNETTNTFNIIEHMHKDNLYYEKHLISFTDVINAYNGFVYNFQKGSNVPSLYSFCLRDTDCKNRYIIDEWKIFVKNISDKKEKIFGSLEYIPTFRKLFAETISNESTFKKNANKLLEGFNNIISAKRIEKYKYANLSFNRLDAVIYLDKIIALWGSIRMVVGRYLYTSIYDLRKLCTLLVIIDQIYDLEKNLHILIFESYFS